MGREGRSLRGQTGQSHPEGWVLRRPKKRKTHLFFIVKDALECDGSIRNEPGRWISERKRTDESEVKDGSGDRAQLRRASGADELVLGFSDSCRPA